ncbi:hypothetical protein GCM10010140_46760 [Streptosporangium pseudovulgare]|uniref:Uncharacterized protein n=1 Tax=Streptosporangium pseudovulgare TaxID=35765 RepID=A0ABQ2R6E5_9ACTN|nr:hypothetical protein GCM10010140_46760 [Streptosporangium pseudovulgare]
MASRAASLRVKSAAEWAGRATGAAAVTAGTEATGAGRRSVTGVLLGRGSNGEAVVALEKKHYQESGMKKKHPGAWESA